MKTSTTRLRLSHVLAACAVFGGALSAQDADPRALQWENESLHFETEFGQQEVQASYEFVNASQHPVTIENVSASCGCTVPSLEKQRYGAGETGELEAIFTIGARQGHQHKTITVETKAGPNAEPQNYSLTLDVDIPIPVSVTPRVNFWRVGVDQDSKTFRIVLHDELPLAINGLTPRSGENDTFDYRIETVVENKEYLVHLTPRAPDQKARVIFYLQSEGEAGNIFETYPLYAYVR